MTEKSKSQSDSDGQVTFTGEPGGGTTPPMEIRFIPTVIPTLAFTAGQPAGEPKKKKRQLSTSTQALYARVREIPRSVSLEAFCQRCDAMQRPFPMPQEWQGEG